MPETPAIVIAHIVEGEVSPTYHVIGENVRLFVVDENSRSDRVYEWLRRDDASVVADLIPEGTAIGSNQDARHAAVSNRYWAEHDGRPMLSVVGKDES